MDDRHGAPCRSATVDPFRRLAAAVGCYDRAMAEQTDQRDKVAEALELLESMSAGERFRFFDHFCEHCHRPRGYHVGENRICYSDPAYDE